VYYTSKSGVMDLGHNCVNAADAPVDVVEFLKANPGPCIFLTNTPGGLELHREEHPEYLLHEVIKQDYPRWTQELRNILARTTPDYEWGKLEWVQEKTTKAS
jgi:ribonucleotide monophosphatase NagD (HAD superfamily)